MRASTDSIGSSSETFSCSGSWPSSASLMPVSSSSAVPLSVSTSAVTKEASEYTDRVSPPSVPLVSSTARDFSRTALANTDALNSAGLLDSLGELGEFGALGALGVLAEHVRGTGFTLNISACTSAS